MRSTRLAVNILRQWQQHSRRVAGGLPAQGRTDNPSAPGPLKPISHLFFCYRKTQLTHLSRPPPVVGNGVVDFFTPAPAPLKPIQTIQSRTSLRAWEKWIGTIRRNDCLYSGSLGRLNSRRAMVTSADSPRVVL